MCIRDRSEDGYEITTQPQDFYTVLEALESNGIKPESAQIEMVAKTETQLTQEDQIKKFNRMIDMFDENDDVQEVWHNLVMDDEDE